MITRLNLIYFLSSVFAPVLFIISRRLEPSRLQQVAFYGSFLLAAIAMLYFIGFTVYGFYFTDPRPSERSPLNDTVLLGITLCISSFVLAFIVRENNEPAELLQSIGWALFFVISLPVYLSILAMILQLN